MNHPSELNTLVWLRRDLRLDDQAALSHALAGSAPVQPVFVFDTDILKQFPDPQDRRLTFIAQTLGEIDEELKRRGGGLLVLHGKAEEIIPKLAHALNAAQVVAAEDYEPLTRARDHTVANALGKRITWVKDQVIFAPNEIRRDESSPYKVYTPYANAWRAKLTPMLSEPLAVDDKDRYADCDQLAKQATQNGLSVLSLAGGASQLLRAMGYQLIDDPLWTPHTAQKRLADFIRAKSAAYDESRDMLAEDGTSRLSPYLRFGLVSIRECVQKATEANAPKWLSELIWREFYAMILYHFPESALTEWNPRYRDTLHWSQNEVHFAAWKEGRTGYPVVDAAMRQLLQDGWMHNRARMIVASFLTKHLRIDWRKGERHFGQYLMDYDLASNVGGWQWAASTGTDAQPYFRVFNPVLQSKKFDPKGDYIRRYVPELRNVDTADIHAPWERGLLNDYYPPIVRHEEARAAAIAMFGAN